MKSKRNCGVAALLCAVGGVGAGSASAQTTNPFGCTASTAVATLGSTNLLPGATSANPPDTPCATDNATLSAVPLVVRGALNLGTIGPVQATTDLSTATANGSTVYVGATATSTVSAVVPGVSIGITTPSVATVDYACVNNALKAGYSSTLNLITINGATCR